MLQWKKHNWKYFKRIDQSLKDNKFSKFEIIIVDDFSNDGTKEILNNLKRDEKLKFFFHDKNQGKGAAIHTALSNTTGDITIIQDADLEYDPSDYNKLLVPFLRLMQTLFMDLDFMVGKYIRIHFWHF